MKETSSNRSRWRTKCCRMRKSANCTTREANRLSRREDREVRVADSLPPWTCLRCLWEEDWEVAGDGGRGKVVTWSISCPSRWKICIGEPSRSCNWRRTSSVISAKVEVARRVPRSLVPGVVARE
uniref:Uncharacterized protein n=1 Tax=Cacopsylla melanoneura TaxID=428564 RepID=A0A8D8RD72_9HEMI